MLLVREVYSDWAAERRGTIRIHRADQAGHAPPPATDTATAAKRYAVAGKLLLSRLRTFLAFPEWFYLNEPVNTMTPPRATPGGLATQFSSAGHFDLADDEAMIVTVPAAAKETAPYQGIQLGSMWYVSLDYVNHQTSLTADQARIDPDGRMRFVISEREPRGRELARANRARPRLRADPLAAADPRPRPRGRPRRSRSPRSTNSRNACRSTTRPGCRNSSGGRASPPARPRSQRGCWADAAAGQGGRGGGGRLRPRPVDRAGQRARGRRRGAGRAHRRPAGRRGQGGRRARTARAGRPHRPGGRRGGGTADGYRARCLRPGRRAGLQRAGDAADQGTGRGRPGRCPAQLRRERRRRAPADPAVHPRPGGEQGRPWS